jgi:hypothetical protein
MTAENYPKFLEETKARGVTIEKTILGAFSRAEAMSMRGMSDQHFLGRGLSWNE